jgi:hypothetical protein
MNDPHSANRRNAHSKKQSHCVVDIPGPIYNQLRMHPPESFRDVAVPADGPVRGENFRELFGPEPVPFGGLAIRVHQSQRMIKML